MEYKIRANNQKEAVEVYKAIRKIQQGKHNIAVNADSRKDAVRIYKEAKRVCDSKIKDFIVGNMEAYEWWNKYGGTGYWDDDLILEWPYDTKKRATEYFNEMKSALPNVKMHLAKKRNRYVIVFDSKFTDSKLKDKQNIVKDGNDLSNYIIIKYDDTDTIYIRRKDKKQFNKNDIDTIKRKYPDAEMDNMHGDNMYVPAHRVYTHGYLPDSIVKDRKDNFLSTKAKELKQDIGLYQRNAKKRADGSAYAKNTGRKQNVHPWNRRVTEAMNDALELIANGEKLDIALDRLNKCINDYMTLMNDSSVSKEDKEKLKDVIARANQIKDKIINYTK